MDEKIKILIDNIEHKITSANNYYRRRADRLGDSKIDQVDGMLEALQIITGDKYTIEGEKVKKI